jgi:hypothetical protein
MGHRVDEDLTVEPMPDGESPRRHHQVVTDSFRQLLACHDDYRSSLHASRLTEIIFNIDRQASVGSVATQPARRDRLKM